MKSLPKIAGAEGLGRGYKGSLGQALLIVLLTMAVVLTVVLSIVSRSITDISVTTYEEESQRAFDAAEAGVEKVLLEGAAVSEDIGQARYEVEVKEQTPSNNEFVFPTTLTSGESATFWFVSHNDDGSLVCDEPGGKPCLYGAVPVEICWGDPSGSENSAIEISFYFDETQSAVASPNNYSNVKITRRVFDSDNTRANDNNFDTATNCSQEVGEQGFAYSTGDISFPGCGVGCLVMAKVRVLFNSNSLSVGILGGAGNLPPQGDTIESTGIAGESTRKVEVFQGYSELPFVFDAAVFSSGGIEKP